MLNEVATRINALSPDIVLLSEVKNWDLEVGGWIVGNVRQAERIASLTGMNFVSFNVVRTGWTGHKSVTILSRHALSKSVEHPVSLMPGQIEKDHGTIEANVNIDGVDHRVFATRFCAVHLVSDTDNSPNHVELQKNIKGHEEALQIIQGIPGDTPVIFGGNFNTDESNQHYVDFVQRCGLTRALQDGPDDIFFRGRYSVGTTDVQRNWDTSVSPLVSDHAWLLVELTRDNWATCIKQTVPSTLSAGATAIVSVTFRNSGATTWEPKQGYRLGFYAPRDNMTWGIKRIGLSVAVPPAGTHCRSACPMLDAKACSTVARANHEDACEPQHLQPRRAHHAKISYLALPTDAGLADRIAAASLLPMRSLHPPIFWALHT